MTRYIVRTSLLTQMVKRLPAMWEAQVQSLGWEDLLEKEMATHSSILAWKIPWTEKPGGLHFPWGHKDLDRTQRLHFHFFTSIAFKRQGLLQNREQVSVEEIEFRRVCIKFQVFFG